MNLERNPSIELYRILLMFGIVLLHTIGCGDIHANWISCSLKFCVVGFVFISGYFGLGFSWLKLGKLYALAAFCALVGAVVQWFRMPDMNAPEIWLVHMKGLWFLHAYAILMMFAPILNYVAAAGEYKMMVMPIVVLVFGWSYAYDIGHLRPFVFPAAGLGAHTPLTLIGIYLLARVFRLSGIENQLTGKWILMAVPVCLLIGAIGLAPYNSPFAFVLAACLFVFFKRHVRCGKWVLFVAPSMFSVYLLHVSKPGIDYIRDCGNWMVANGVSKYMMFIIVAVSLFSVCLMIDIVRRVALKSMRC